MREREACEDEVEVGAVLPPNRGTTGSPEKRETRTESRLGPRGESAFLTPCFWASGLQNCERIDSRCCKAPHLWEFATAALGNQCKC